MFALFSNCIIAQEKPNIIFILCDDHRWDAMGFMGHPFLETPHMDRMAREGVHFENAFVIGIHYRGTDKYTEAPTVDYERVKLEVENALAEEAWRRDQVQCHCSTY